MPRVTLPTPPAVLTEGASLSDSQPVTEGPVAMPRGTLPSPPPVLNEQPQVAEPQQQQVVGLQHSIATLAPPPPVQSIDDLMDKMFGEEYESGDDDEEDTAFDSPHRQSPSGSGGSNLPVEDVVGDENPAPNNNEDESSTNTSNNELAPIAAAPPSNLNSRHAGRIEKIIHINKLESRRKKTTITFGIIKRERNLRFCKKKEITRQSTARPRRNDRVLWISLSFKVCLFSRTADFDRQETDYRTESLESYFFQTTSVQQNKELEDMWVASALKFHSQQEAVKRRYRLQSLVGWLSFSVDSSPPI